HLRRARAALDRRGGRGEGEPHHGATAADRRLSLAVSATTRSASPALDVAAAESPAPVRACCGPCFAAVRSPRSRSHLDVLGADVCDVRWAYCPCCIPARRP